MTQDKAPLNQDTAQLEALGYDSKFDRSISMWQNFALGFTYLSPVVGVYTVFAFAIATGGPAMFWSYLFVGLGQLLVAMVFGEIVSQFPIAGGLYPWARRLVAKWRGDARAESVFGQLAALVGELWRGQATAAGRRLRRVVGDADPRH